MLYVSLILLHLTVQTLEAVTKMVQDGNITAKDAIRHAEALNSIKARLCHCAFVDV